MEEIIWVTHHEQGTHLFTASRADVMRVVDLYELDIESAVKALNKVNGDMYRVSEVASEKKKSIDIVYGQVHTFLEDTEEKLVDGMKHLTFEPTKEHHIRQRIARSLSANNEDWVDTIIALVPPDL